MTTEEAYRQGLVTADEASAILAKKLADAVKERGTALRELNEALKKLGDTYEKWGTR